MKPINSLTQQSVRCTSAPLFHTYTFAKYREKKCVCHDRQRSRSQHESLLWTSVLSNWINSILYPQQVFLLLFCYISLNQFTQSVLNPSSIESHCGCHTEQGDVPRTHTKLFLVFFWKDTRRFISFCCGLGETHSYIFFCVNLPEGSVWTLGHWLPWQPHPPVSYNHRA